MLLDVVSIILTVGCQLPLPFIIIVCDNEYLI